MDDTTPYPVRVDAALDPHLSRWLWLVKWLLLVPHWLALALLWTFALVLLPVVGVCIAVTGRYPTGLFAFEVGVLRWTWRVQHYGYGALGTDRYPPFTLAALPGDAAHLDVDRPGHLSRWLWLVKWVLAVPHLVVVGVFVGGGLWAVGRTGADDGSWAAGGLVGLLVLVAGVVLLVRGRYPVGIYDLVLGLDRWAIRVAAYLLLTTDRYPPFRLDTGGTDPGRGRPPVAGPGPVVSTSTPGWTGSRIVAMVVGSVLLLTSTGVLAGGGVALWADRTQRVDGYVLSGTTGVDSPGYAMVGPDVGLTVQGGPLDLAGTLGDTRVVVTQSSGAALFVGVAPTAAVDTYLRGVAHRTLTGLGQDGDGLVMGPGTPMPMSPGPGGGMELAGGPPATPPGEQTFWTSSVSGPGTLTLDWAPRAGNWSVVVMRADGSPAVDAGVRVGATAPALPWVAGGLLALGGLLAVGGALTVLLVTRSAHRRTGAPGPPTPTTPPAEPVLAAPR